MLGNYKNILFDFDGVIIDSAVIREQGFIEVFSHLGDEAVEQLLNFHRKNGGLSRYVKIKHLYENILNTSISKEEINHYADRFSLIMKDLLVNPALLISDPLDFIKANFKQKNLHIVSGSDQTELRFLAKQLEIDQYFISIMGSPTTKPDIIRALMQEHGYEVSSCCLIGDAINDYDAAKEFGIDFFGYNNPALQGLGKAYIKKINI